MRGVEYMERSPDNRERPNASETKPKTQPSEATLRALGKAAVKGAQKR